MSTERRYRLRRIKAGDYLLLGNDGHTLYRIVRYVDGPTYGLIDMKRDRDFWSVWRWRGRPLQKSRTLTEDELDVTSTAWASHIETMLNTRAEAIERALSL